MEKEDSSSSKFKWSLIFLGLSGIFKILEKTTKENPTSKIVPYNEDAAMKRFEIGHIPPTPRTVESDLKIGVRESSIYLPYVSTAYIEDYFMKVFNAIKKDTSVQQIMQTLNLDLIKSSYLNKWQLPVAKVTAIPKDMQDKLLPLIYKFALPYREESKRINKTRQAYTQTKSLNEEAWYNSRARSACKLLELVNPKHKPIYVLKTLQKKKEWIQKYGVPVLPTIGEVEKLKDRIGAIPIKFISAYIKAAKELDISQYLSIINMKAMRSRYKKEWIGWGVFDVC